MARPVGKWVVFGSGRSCANVSGVAALAEQLVTVRTRRGFQKLEWQKLRERNEALDCRVYARAAAWIVGADRWSEARWADLETQLGVTTNQDAGAESASTPTITTAGAVRPIRRAVQRRTVRSSYMS